MPRPIQPRLAPTRQLAELSPTEVVFKDETQDPTSKAVEEVVAADEPAAAPVVEAIEVSDEDEEPEAQVVEVTSQVLKTPDARRSASRAASVAVGKRVTIREPSASVSLGLGSLGREDEDWNIPVAEHDDPDETSTQRIVDDVPYGARLDPKRKTALLPDVETKRNQYLQRLKAELNEELREKGEDPIDTAIPIKDMSFERQLRTNEYKRAMTNSLRLLKLRKMYPQAKTNQEAIKLHDERVKANRRAGAAKSRSKNTKNVAAQEARLAAQDDDDDDDNPFLRWAGK